MEGHCAAEKMPLDVSYPTYGPMKPAQLEQQDVKVDSMSSFFTTQATFGGTGRASSDSNILAFSKCKKKA